MSTALIAILSLALLLLPIYVYLRTKGRFASHAREQGAGNGIITYAAPFFLLAVLLSALVTGLGVFAAIGMGATDKVVVAADAEDRELGNLDTNKAHAEAAEVMYTVKTTSAPAKALGVGAFLLPLVGWLSALLCYLPMFRAMHAGDNPLTGDNTHLTSLAAWILLITLPAAALCNWGVRSIVNMGDTSVLHSFGFDSLQAGFVALVIAALLRRGAKAVELEEATV